MSTRCQIEFKEITKYIEDKQPKIERRTIYRHSDGYPESVIPDIEKFVKWDRGFSIEYTPANFIYWNKRQVILSLQSDHPTDKREQQEIEEQWSKLGFGICENDEFHGDIEYFYEVIQEVTEIHEHEYKKTLKIICYKIDSDLAFSEPITRERMKKIKEVTL